MVVGGESYEKRVIDSEGWPIKDDDTREYLTANGFINDVELCSFSKEKNKCSRFVNPFYYDGYVKGPIGKHGNGLPEFGLVSETMGLTGAFSKDTAIVCGGKNLDEYRSTCYEWDSNVNV